MVLAPLFFLCHCEKRKAREKACVHLHVLPFPFRARQQPVILSMTDALFVAFLLQALFSPAIF